MSSSERLRNCRVRNLKIDQMKKRPAGAEKQRLKKLKSVEVEASKCAKLTDLFGAGTTNPPAATGAAAPETREEDPMMKSEWRQTVSNVSLGLARIHF